jgi:hypothetical protein
MRVLFTGSREWVDDHAVVLFLEGLSKRVTRPSEITVVHGGARGLDSTVGVVAHHMGMTVEVHPADWQRDGRAAGFIRNQQMVDLRADLVVGFPLGESRGTRDCIRRALKAGLKVISYDEVSQGFVLA